uniref:Trehalase n=1 Tax=Ditylenchus dipsaci TaxID=166011 RepID=A0A915DSB1_9BILA
MISKKKVETRSLASTHTEVAANNTLAVKLLAQFLQQEGDKPPNSDNQLVASTPLATNNHQGGGETDQPKENIHITAAAVVQAIKDMRDQIYCSGTLLAAVQGSKLFGDCKHFVDMPLKTNAENTLAAWNLLLSSEHFEQPGGELEDYQPLDFNAEEQFDNIIDPSFRSWAQELHRKWPTLCRRVSEKVLSDPNRYSLIALPKPFVVPGGRFREMYYWDSFFTIKGLLASGIRVWLCSQWQRVYYLNRSQPLCLHEGDEILYHQQKVLSSRLEVLLVPLPRGCTRPRPESYREDVESAEHIQDLLEKCRLWGDIAAAAESGRDFSARWFENNPEAPMAGKMGSTRTSSILPVDLNSIICGNLKIFAEFYSLLGNEEASKHSMEQYELMRETIHKIFWNEELGCWFDWDIITQKHLDNYYDTNFFHFSLAALTTGVLAFPGGLPSSLITSGQQWDFPNAWAPTTWVIINGLRSAEKLCDVKNNGGRMYEKYNVASGCFRNAGGVGGEYEVQEGFGWTNGVILDLLKTYHSEINWNITDGLENNSNVQSEQCECCRPKWWSWTRHPGSHPRGSDQLCCATTEPQAIFIHSVASNQQIVE